ncbi:endonuclease [Brevibacterium sp. 5221]|uniref:Endonuclease n=1 Tax=Brevibacterium rongguiense TaxID=2695267 RepID=A0A6N9H8B7_9MICO|nr:endonuclease [Brevibacterium rongguiense]MYM19794.1 endonuclease [Brevibacterium rongguiense]
MAKPPARIAGDLLDEHGTTYAQQAGIRLADRPAPLFQLLVLANLLSARIGADIAVAAARELWAAGLTTPARMRDSGRAERVAALGRAGYRRYDESTATRLRAMSEQLLADYRGDLRRLRADGGADLAALGRLLQAFPGIGPAGAQIFLREAQGVWSLEPVFDAKALEGARRAGLPADPEALAGLVAPADRAQFAAALVRRALQK